MKQVIPFYKEIVFDKQIANITSISLEHKEKILEDEVSGEFIIYGDYKTHNDTTEKENFKFKLPFTALIPDNIDLGSISIDIADFKYEQIDNDVLRVDIEFSIEGDEEERIDDNEKLEDEVLDTIEEDNKYEVLEDTIDSMDQIDKEIDEILNINNDEKEIDEITDNDEDERETYEERDFVLDMEQTKKSEVVENKQEKVIDTTLLQPEEKIEVEETKEVKEEYITYHVHVVTNNDSIESIMKQYNASLDYLKEYNDIKELKVGDKVIIPFIQDE